MQAFNLVDVVAAVRCNGGRFWLCQRKTDGGQGGQAGMWEYPGGKVEPGEQLRAALMRELQEEFGVVAHIDAVLDSITYQHFRVTFFAVTMPDPLELREHVAAGWFDPEEVCRLEHLPSGTIFNARHLASMPQAATLRAAYLAFADRCEGKAISPQAFLLAWKEEVERRLLPAGVRKFEDDGFSFDYDDEELADAGRDA